MKPGRYFYCRAKAGSVCASLALGLVFLVGPPFHASQSSNWRDEARQLIVYPPPEAPVQAASSETSQILLPGWAKPMDLDWPGDGWPLEMPQMSLIGGPYLKFKDDSTPSALWLRPGWAFMGDSANRWWWIPPSPLVDSDFTPRLPPSIPTGTFQHDRGSDGPRGGDPGDPPLLPPTSPPIDPPPAEEPPVKPVPTPNVPEPRLLAMLMVAGLMLRRR